MGAAQDASDHWGPAGRMRGSVISERFAYPFPILLAFLRSDHETPHVHRATLTLDTLVMQDKLYATTIC